MKISNQIKKFTTWLKSKKNNNVQPARVAPEQKIEVEPAVYKPKVRYILSLEGGGSRGLVELFCLEGIEKILKELNKSENIADTFDIIAGTSVGGIFAGLLALKNDTKAKEMINLFQINYANMYSSKQGLFSKLLENKYTDDGRAKTFAEIFRENTFADFKKNALIMCFDISSSRIQPLTKSNALDVKIKDALMATTAAPTYFNPYDVKINGETHTLVDGGVCANNPSLYAYKYAKELYPDVDEIRILSIASYRNTTDLRGIKSKRDWVDFTKSGSLPLQSVYHISQEQACNDIARSLPGVKYLRLVATSKEYGLHIKMDTTSATDIENLKRIGRDLAEKSRDKIISFFAED